MMNEIVRYGCVRASLRELSSRRKSKTRLGGTGSQKEVAALRTMPGGLPGSSTLFLVMTRTSSAPLPDSVVHWCAAEAVTPPQKLITILSASFSILFLPSVLVITAANDLFHKDMNFFEGFNWTERAYGVLRCMVQSFTTDVTGWNVAGHDTSKAFALAIQRSNPPACTEGEPSVHQQFVDAVHRPVVHLDVLHPGHLTHSAMYYKYQFCLDKYSTYLTISV